MTNVRDIGSAPRARERRVPMRKEAQVDVKELVSLIRPLASVRRENAFGKRQDEKWTAELKDYLSTQPEGERELWDTEREPHVGVALVDGGGPRWCDLTDLTDLVVLWAARSGLLRLAPDGYDAITALADAGVLPLEFKSNLVQFRKAVHQGGPAGAGKLVMLHDKRGA